MEKHQGTSDQCIYGSAFSLSVDSSEHYEQLWAAQENLQTTAKYINKKEIYLRSESTFQAERMLLTSSLTFSYNALHTDHVSNKMS